MFNDNDDLNDLDLEENQDELFEEEDESTDDQDDLDDSDEDDVEDDEDVEDGEEEDAEDNPPWANKRIKKMAERHKASKAKIKELESEVARLTELSGADDPKLYVSVAESIGILPRFIKSDEIKKIAEAKRVEASYKTCRDILEEMEDSGQSEYEDANGKVWTRADIRKRKRAAEEELPSLKKAADKAKTSARKQMIAVINAGLKALRTQKKGDEKAKQTKMRQDDNRSNRQRLDDYEEVSRTRNRKSAAKRQHSFTKMSARDRAREKLHALFMADD